MEYTIKGLADLAGVTPRTLRWYDKLGLLHPDRTTETGYRIYGPEQVDRLQQILFYRELGLPLAEIGAILDGPGFDRQAALQSHLKALQQRKDQLDSLIKTVERTLLNEKGEINMTDEEKFAAFQRKAVEENEKKYGQEAREKYGDQAVGRANQAILGLSGEEAEEWQALDREILSALASAVRAGEDPAGAEGQRIAGLHAKWLTTVLKPYLPERHRGIAELYVCDERFTAYYDREVPGCAQFLRDAVAAYVQKQ